MPSVNCVPLSDRAPETDPLSSLSRPFAVDLSSSPDSVCNLKPSLHLGGSSRRSATMSATSLQDVSGYRDGKDPFDLVSFIDQVSLVSSPNFFPFVRELTPSLALSRPPSPSSSTPRSSLSSSSSSSSVSPRLLILFDASLTLFPPSAFRQASAKSSS